MHEARMLDRVDVSIKHERDLETLDHAR